MNCFVEAVEFCLQGINLLAQTDDLFVACLHAGRESLHDLERPSLDFLNNTIPTFRLELFALAAWSLTTLRHIALGDVIVNCAQHRVRSLLRSGLQLLLMLN